MDVRKSRNTVIKNGLLFLKIIIITMFHLPRELLLFEINKYLAELDRQILRKVCSLFSSLFPHKIIGFNHMDLELVHIKRYQKLWSENTINTIVFKEDLESLKYLCSPPNGEPCPWSSWTTALAASSGNIHILKCLRSPPSGGEPCPWDWTTPAWAAEQGHLECIKYAHENGCPWDLKTTERAAEEGHLECLKYAHENGCEWGTTTTAKAAKGGRLECLKYAHSPGFGEPCPWDYTTIEFAQGHLECLKYARENGCPS